MKPMRRVGTWLSLAAVVGGLALMAPDTQAQSSNEVHLVEIQGTVDISTDGGIRWVKTTTSQPVRAGDHLRTGPNSRAALRWSDSSVVSCKARTEIEILPPHAPQAQAGLRIFEGLLSFFHRDKPGRIRVITRGTAAGINGTEFVIAVDTVNGAERTTLSIIDGIVSFSNEVSTLTLTNGEQAVATPGSAPQRTAGFVVNNLLQWAFYYPAVLDLRDMTFSRDEEQALAESFAAYRAGDLLEALAKYGNRQPVSEAERIYQAALLLAVGEVDQTSNALAQSEQANASERGRRLAAALRQQIAAVKRESPATMREPELATELLAASYYEQSRAGGDETLKRALNLAKRAATNSPEFGFAWERVAELEFSFGRIDKANDALNKSLALSPRNAQALALQGFLLGAQNKPGDAIASFDRALAVDSALGNAWLGRGLCRIRRGDRAGGREDLLIAAALEPQRAALRSYLGKAYAESKDRDRALHELELAKQLDPNDPSAWLYSALVKAEHSRINEGIRDLEKSQELNDNRRVYRSRLRLDQDQAVRGANLALLYEDAGLADVGLREASRAIAADYGNYSAHLFLANSYLVAGSANPFAGRFESPVASEFLLAKLLGPPDGRILAQSAAHARHTPLFERDALGLSSTTEYQSSGSWYQSVAQYGTYRNTGYSLEANLLWDPGETPHRENEYRYFAASVKHQLTPRDGLLLEIRDLWQEYGDIGQRYNPDQARGNNWTKQRQEPIAIAALDHQWSEAHHTLFLAAHANASLDYTNKRGGVYLLATTDGVQDGFAQTDLTQEYELESMHNVFELQHLFTSVRTRTIAGIRFQHSTYDTFNRQVMNNGNAPGLQIYFGNPGTVIADQSTDATAMRLSPYVYEHWQVAEPLWLIAGLSYDYQRIPENTRFAPVSGGDSVRQQISPKAALVWTTSDRSTIRAAYSQSLGGVDFEQNIRLEPTQLAGFVQTYRTLFPNALTGPAAGAHVETYDLSFDHRSQKNTYSSISGQFLRSTAERDVGAFRREQFTSRGPAVQIEERLRFEEFSAAASLHQLFGDYFSAGLQYRLSRAQLRRSHPTVSDSINFADGETRGILHLVGINSLFRHPSGFFAGAEANWWSQNVSAPSGIPSEAVCLVNLSAGYRLPRRRAQITVGVFNVTAADYRLYPINLYPDLPRERTFFTRLELNF